ncbi:MAG: aminotransferase class III-fold pyridoxal phosphate-dependent enzyme, partial [Herpetosiphon sp.]|nr:aminotransferase class III-fold pyridoxal phosphate-dependent enzyme [Herpetosiphon sp.]
VGRADLMEYWRVQGEPLHTATFMGHPLGCAGALAAIKELQERNLVERCAELGNYTLNRLRTFAHDVPHIGDVRGRGLMIGIELVTDRISKTPDPERALATVYACLQHGVVILNGGMNGNVISITPPFIISQEQLDYALDVLENVVR